jgi:hypothetical protein
MLRDGSDGGSCGGMTLLGGAKHQCLVDGSQPLHLGLCLLESRLELLSSHLEVLDVSSGTIKQGNFAGFLVRHGEGILEPAVTVPQLVAPPLFRLDTLTTDSLATHVGATTTTNVGGRLEVGVVFIVITVLILGRPPARCL